MQKKVLILVAASVSLLALASVLFLAGQMSSRKRSANAQKEAALRAEAEANLNGTKDAAPNAVEPDGMNAVLQKLMKDPAMKEMVRSQQKAVMSQMYAPLFKEMGLAPEQREKFMGLLIENALSSVVQAGNVLQGQGADRAEAIKSIQERQKQMNEGVRELLGQADYARYEEYQKTLGERTQLSTFRQQLAGGEGPLQESQAAQLMQILTEEKAKVPSILASGPNGAGQNLSALSSPETMNQHFEWQEDLNRRVLQRAEQTLTPSQLSAYDAFLRQQLDQQKVGIKMARDLFNGPRAGAESGPAPGVEVVPIPLK